MHPTWTRIEDMRPIDFASSICFIFMVSVGIGLIVQTSFVDGNGLWVLAFVALWRVHHWLERKAARPYVIAAVRVWEARADDGAPLTPEDEETLPTDLGRATP